MQLNITFKYREGNRQCPNIGVDTPSNLITFKRATEYTTQKKMSHCTLTRHGLTWISRPHSKWRHLIPMNEIWRKISRFPCISHQRVIQISSGHRAIVIVLSVVSSLNWWLLTGKACMENRKHMCHNRLHTKCSLALKP
jgi:hypothetical protein